MNSFVDNNKLLIGISLIVLGAALAFAGRNLITFVSFIISFAAIALFISYFGLIITDKSYGTENQPDWLLWTLFGSSLVIGLVAAFLISKFAAKFGIGILAACGGIALGIMICQVTAISNSFIYYGIIIACGAATCILASFLERELVISTTAFMGSYMLVRGVSLFAGGYPNEMTVA